MPHGPGARRDVQSAAGLGLVALAYLVASRRYPLDTLAAPGPGVFPLAAGALALVLAVGQVARALVRGEDAPGARAPGAGGRRLAAMVVLLVAYAAAVGTAGFLASSVVLVFVSSRLLGQPGWLRPAALALGVTAAAWAIFVAWLGVPLPAGVLRR
jgi:hypothetical protein